MSFKTTQRDVETRFAAQWTETPIAYENVDFTKPSNASWVRLTIIDGSGKPYGIMGSTGQAVDNGLISVQVFVPEGTGTQEAKRLADEILPIYQDTRFSGIVTYIATVNTVGVGNGWHQTNVTIPYKRVRSVT